MRDWLDALLAVVFAPECAACARPLDSPSHGPVCSSCWSSIEPLTDPVQNFSPGVRPLVEKIASAGEYDGALREVVHALKYHGRRSLARPLGALMRDRGQGVLEGAELAVPVPLHHSRLRQRGFNQARDLSLQIGLPVVLALRRVRPTGQRLSNVHGAFAATRRARHVAGRIVLLVDDVATTGATLDACARTLSEAGAREVRALTAARALRARR